MKIFLTILLIFSSISKADELIEHSLGVAKSQSGEIVYSEKHTSRFLENSLVFLKTEYFDRNKNNFGSILTDYSKDQNIPNYIFEDKRSYRYVKVEKNGESILSQIRIDKDTKPKEKTFKTQPNMVAGQGLHAFIRNQLKDFKANKNHIENIQFLVPLNEDSYKFRIRVKEQDLSKITLRLEAESWFFRILAPHIDVTYEKSTNRLLIYDGPSNLLDENGKKINVVISYEYDTSPVAE